MFIRSKAIPGGFDNCPVDHLSKDHELSIKITKMQKQFKMIFFIILNITAKNSDILRRGEALSN